MKSTLKNTNDRIWKQIRSKNPQVVGLVAFGIADIVMGLFCFSLAMLVIIMASSTSQTDLSFVAYATAVGFLFGTTGWYIVLGLGSLRARRWACALLVAGGWVTVFFGAIGLALLFYVLPELYDALSRAMPTSPNAVMYLVTSVVVVLVFLQVIFPLMLISFYGLASVRRICEERNPTPCWTDNYALPLLVMVFISVLGCLAVLGGALTNYTVFFYGRLLFGISGFAVVAVLSVASGYIGWGALHRQMKAWWIAYALVLLTAASMMLTSATLDMDHLFTCMGYSAGQIELQNEFLSLSPAVLTVTSILWGLMASVYLLWVRECFVPIPVEKVVKSYQQRMVEEEATRVKKNPPDVIPSDRMRLD